ncbi:hypothetical protein FGG08_003045 [Glutinoglossum americanum]|uniref:DNA mismatch repair protein HSM3 N-terminal domain-containing protein n=1 Tax=Glutinoglossum americanum TaxID=1670608 RepID=A0A9P8L3Y1_9PEZI|nr:hypothetical protein FGG08_003045 [Glutinoglossum americanum]
MAENPPVSLPDLQQHLLGVAENPDTKLDARLFDKVEAQLTEQNLPPLLPTLLPQLTSILPILKQNPEPVTSFIVTLLRPVPFTSCLIFTSPTSLVEALHSPSSPVNILALSLLEKAAASPSDAAIVAGIKEVVSELVTLWLCTPDTEVAEKAAGVLGNLLEVDCGTSDAGDIDVDMEDADSNGGQNGRGQGLVWRRIFGDRDIYSLLFSICSLKTTGTDGGQLSKREKTLSQARLLGLVQRLAILDFGIIMHSHHPDLEASYGLQNDREGFLDFVAVHMVDTKDDVLMHMTLIDFFTELLKAVSSPDTNMSSSIASLSLSPSSSSSLDFLISRGLHDRTSSYYLDPTSPKLDPLDITFLSGRAATYLSVYASHYPNHFLTTVRAGGNMSVIDSVLSRISETLVSRSLRQEAPSYDLHLLTSLPRASLLPRIPPTSSSIPRDLWRSSPVSLIPLQRTNPEYLNALATLFHGPFQAAGEAITYPPSSAPESLRPPTLVSESAAARALYTLYLAKEPNFYKTLVGHAEVVALKETAIAALNLLSAIITANWSPLPSSEQETNSNSIALPTEDQLASLLPPSALPPPPPSGLSAILHEPTLGVVIPYLLAPAQSFSNLVGGRGDAESAAYKVAVAKFGAAKKLFEGLKQDNSSEAVQLRPLFAERIARGPWASDSRPGEHLATMEL